MGSVQGNLSAALTTLVGRRREAIEVGHWLASARLVTLTGVGGVGKTRLAHVAAADFSHLFPGGTWWVDLAQVRDPSAVESTVAQTLGLPDLGAGAVALQIAGHLAELPALIVLDNCEHLADICAALAQELLSATRELRIMTTSRHTLGVPGEHVFVVPPLPDNDAVALLRDRVAAVQAESRINAASPATTAALCAALDGLPLSIELMAPRLRTMTVDQVVNRVTDHFALLTSGGPNVSPRHRSLSVVIHSSYELCDRQEQMLWDRASVFVGCFSLEAAEEVCSGRGIERDDVLDVLDRLIAQSVVATVNFEGMSRYRLMESVRQFGSMRLAESGEERRLLRRHREFFLSLAKGVADEWYGPGQVESLARLRIDRGNLLAALECDDDPQDTLALATALRHLWGAGGFLGEGGRCLDQALAAAPEPTPARADALITRANVALYQSDFAGAERFLAGAETLGEELDLPSVLAEALSSRGLCAAMRQRPQEALPLLERALDTHRMLGSHDGVMRTLGALAVTQLQAGDPRGAETSLQFLAVAEACGERRVRGSVLWALGHDAWKRGDLSAGLAYTRSALESVRGFSDPVASGLMLELLAWLTASDGDHHEAARLSGTAASLVRRSGITIDALVGIAEQHRQFEKETIRALGPDTYRREWAEGAAYDDAARAVDYGLECCATRLAPAAPTTPANPLTPREEEVASLLTQGMSSKRIAKLIGRSPRTVDFHVRNILAKLDFTSRSQIAAWWTMNGESARAAL